LNYVAGLKPLLGALLRHPHMTRLAHYDDAVVHSIQQGHCRTFCIADLADLRGDLVGLVCFADGFLAFI